MKQHRRDDAVYALALDWFIRKHQPHGRQVTLGAAAAIWRIACNQRMAPTSSLQLLGFAVEQSRRQQQIVTPLSEDERASYMATVNGAGAARLVTALQNAVGERCPLRLELRGL